VNFALAAAVLRAGSLAPAWSPDGAMLAYECGQDICAINADGSNKRQVTSPDLRGAAVRIRFSVRRTARR